MDVTTEKRVQTFFYGTFMAPAVLAEHGICSREVKPAKLSGYHLTIRPRVNLAKVEGSCVYGSLAAVDADEITRLYTEIERQFGVKYFPETVLAEGLDGSLIQANCYIAPYMKDKAPDPDYVKQLADCIRGLGLPECYAAYVESFI